ncbi:hypothetical protein CCB80_14125 [Armatimonadetes bacterium Uphvl-Ar1]|nr:hypothetical protein CCB80_14125 [Armatimonadetes bacterium Uphvl-Ar1]
MNPKRGFSLIELLVVIAIIATIAAIILPVFSQAKLRAHQYAWIDSARKVNLAVQIYTDDYDGYAMLARQNTEESAHSGNDRTWVQSLMPYTRGIEQFFCPIDSTRPSQLSLMDPDLTPNDPSARYYQLSQRSNFGYNYAYFSPIFRQGASWTIDPRSSSSIQAPSETLIFGESAWEVKNGVPSGGGNYLIRPPCRFVSVSEQVIDSFGLPGKNNNQLYLGGDVWTTKHEPWQSVSGGLFPWFKTKITIAFADGHVKAMNPKSIRNGCDVRPEWSGFIFDLKSYIWDLN